MSPLMLDVGARLICRCKPQNREHKRDGASGYHKDHNVLVRKKNGFHNRASRNDCVGYRTNRFPRQKFQQIAICIIVRHIVRHDSDGKFGFASVKNTWQARVPIHKDNRTWNYGPEFNTGALGEFIVSEIPHSTVYRQYAPEYLALAEKVANLSDRTRLLEMAFRLGHQTRTVALDLRIRTRADRCPLWVKSRHVRRKSDVRFTPHSDRESGFPQKGMSALPAKADIRAPALGRASILA